ncbi:MAG: response regulator receiver sensor signal transduction histidine kinase [Chloroflexi bacterium OLB14]|nr:MAG: response regulator receiver sensor signal transduction histidine kinase [Chloroflexi bacterium OLB14]
MPQEIQKLTPEMLIPRLGEYIVQKGLITEEDLQRALAYQREQTTQNKPYLLGQALIDLKYLSREVLDEVITEQIIQLRSALQASNRNLEQRVQERTAELNEALARLSELSQMKANFVANISHELRTPLTHIKGYIELLLSESLGKISEEQKHALSVSQRATTKLDDMIEDLIMFSLASRGELSMKLEKVDIRRLLSLLLKSAADKAEDRGVKLLAGFPDSIPNVQADPEKIGWVISQLLDNGIKFTPSGGSVTISLKEEGANLIQISIADTGIGIPQHRMTEIFEAFHQLDSSSTRHYGGTGLGLSLVRQIIEAHGSLLDVKSIEGKGSTFKFPLLAIRD